MLTFKCFTTTMPKRNSKRRSGKSSRMVRCPLDPEMKIPAPITIPQNRRHLIQLRAFLVCVSNGSGIINTYISFDPSSTTQTQFGSVTMFAEWTNYVNLYNRVKLVQFDATFSPSIMDDTKGDSLNALSIASVATGTLAVPNSAATVIDNGNSVIWNPLRDYSGVARFFSTRLAGLGWGPVGSPGGVTGLGCPGSIIIYGNMGGFTNSTIFTVKVVGTYLVDTRI